MSLVFEGEFLGLTRNESSVQFHGGGIVEALKRNSDSFGLALKHHNLLVKDGQDFPIVIALESSGQSGANSATRELLFNTP